MGRMDMQNGWTINTCHETIVDPDQLLNLVISCFFYYRVNPDQLVSQRPPNQDPHCFVTTLLV